MSNWQCAIIASGNRLTPRGNKQILSLMVTQFTDTSTPKYDQTDKILIIRIDFSSHSIQGFNTLGKWPWNWYNFKSSFQGKIQTHLARCSYPCKQQLTANKQGVAVKTSHGQIAFQAGEIDLCQYIVNMVFVKTDNREYVEHGTFMLSWCQRSFAE